MDNYYDAQYLNKSALYYLLCIITINNNCLCLGQWTSPVVIGNEMPPIDSFTLTSINGKTAILFGGITNDGFSDKLYIFNFDVKTVVSHLE